ncbi:MAG: NAD(P)H-hydrate dehydratase [Actinomycetota bacterium]|jgi:NAD(P)H-hydrate epimerase|nr:NAD(P)H-hydrate dehydratase [Actinomycetota bacterium]MDA8294087.1 NAD(P)H-hydrate dehydratase [Actinomycetota bacterium]
MQPVLTVTEMRAADEAAQATTPLPALVARAGRAVATAALSLLGGAYGRRVAVVSGKGNNGADGRVAAAHLARRGARVVVVDVPRGTDGPWELPACDLVVDAAFGTGFRGSYRPPVVPPGATVLAVDIPSGVDGDTGRVPGAALPADLTVTFASLKPGLVLGRGRALAGRISVADIGLDVSGARWWLVEDADVSRLVPRRPDDAHKWSAAVLVVAGSPGMGGAAAMAATGALRAGAGMVRLGVPGAELAAQPATEAVHVALPAVDWAGPALEVAARCRAVVVGPGLGRDPATMSSVRRLVAEAEVPVVVDADGLAALTGPEHRKGRAPLVVTPHDGELTRMTGVAPGDDRLAAAGSLARHLGATVLLKGPTTVVARPDQGGWLVTSGTPALATAGSGDVLSGVIGAFVARGVAPGEAAAVAAHVHGRAGATGPGDGLVAGDLPLLVADWLASALPETTGTTGHGEAPGGLGKARHGS